MEKGKAMARRSGDQEFHGTESPTLISRKKSKIIRESADLSMLSLAHLSHGLSALAKH